MEKLRKIGLWIWASKERIVLGLLVIFLTFQVWTVVATPPTVKTTTVPPPGTNPPDPPKAPLPPPNPGADKDYSALHVRNPFWYWSAGNAVADGTTKTEDASIRLLRIQAPPNGTARAQIKTKTTKYYKEGDTIDDNAYKVTRIDAAKKEVEVYSEKQGKKIVLQEQGR